MCASTSRIKNISISDTTTGHIIFQRVYSWKAASAFSNLGSFIRGLYQFAREIDDGVISGVDFEYCSKSITRHKRDDILRANQGDTMHMMSLKSDEIIVTIFFDMNGGIKLTVFDQWKYEIMLNAVKTAFEIKYLSTLQTLHHMTTLDKANSQSNADSSIIGLHRFDDFTDIADHLYDQIFRQEIEDLTAPNIGDYVSVETFEVGKRQHASLQLDPYSLSVTEQVGILLRDLNILADADDEDSLDRSSF